MRGKPGAIDSSGVLSTVFPPEAEYKARYDLQDACYEGNDAYLKLATGGMGPGSKVRSMHSLAYQIVEFHPAHLWPEPLEDLPIVADNDATVEGARQIFEWGNWGEKKQEYARRLPKHGDVYLKAEDVKDAERVYPKLIEPREVTEFEKDERGNAIKVRLDIPIVEENKQRTRTEIWSKENLRVDVYVHDHGPGVKEEELTGKIGGESFRFEDAGIDFVPFVHGQYMSGSERGMGAFSTFLEQMYELDKMLSRGSDMFFRHGKPLWQLLRNEAGQSAVSLKDLRPDEQGGTAEEEVGEGDNAEVVLRPPGLAKMEALIPVIPYEAGRLMVQDALDRLTNASPELTYYAQRDKGDPSGRAIGLMLSAPRKRGEEVRYNGETALLKCVKMCLTIAKHKNSLDQNPGDFDNGDFDSLKFEERDVLPITGEEKAAVVKIELENLEAAISVARILGADIAPLKEKWALLMELDPEEIKDVAPADAEAESIGQRPEVEEIMNRLQVTGGATNGGLANPAGSGGERGPG
jgi:hypothetical protein